MRRARRVGWPTRPGVRPGGAAALSSFVAIENSTSDLDLWKAMDQTSDVVAKVFANGQPFEVQKEPPEFVKVGTGDDLSQIRPYKPKAQGGRRDGLGTTHHEAGTLWMGNDPAKSVTDAQGRFHQIANTYVAGPALLPTIGSPNPMLSGIALVRRLADTLIPPPPRLAAGAATVILTARNAASRNGSSSAGALSAAAAVHWSLALATTSDCSTSRSCSVISP